MRSISLCKKNGLCLYYIVSIDWYKNKISDCHLTVLLVLGKVLALLLLEFAAVRLVLLLFSKSQNDEHNLSILESDESNHHLQKDVSRESRENQANLAVFSLLQVSEKRHKPLVFPQKLSPRRVQ